MAAKKKKAAKKKTTRKKVARKTATRRTASSRSGKVMKKKAVKRTVKKKVVKKKTVKKTAAKPVARKKATPKKATPKKATPKKAAQSEEVRRAAAVRQQLNRAKVGTFHDLFDPCSPEVQAIAQQLRELIMELIPDAQETVYLGWKIALYKKTTEICGIQPAGDRCNFYLTKGAYLRDSQGILEGTGKSIRHVKVRSVVGLAAEGIRDFIKQALEFARN